MNEYVIGTRIDLSFMNDRPIEVEPERIDRWYNVGERVVFIKLQSA